MKNLLLTLIVSASPLMGQSSVAAETQDKLDSLRQSYESAVKHSVEKGHQPAIDEVERNFAAAIGREMEKAVTARDLETANALRSEKERMDAKLPVPTNTRETNPTLANLRNTYLQQEVLIQKKIEQATAPLTRRYMEDLTKLQHECTRQRKMGEALTVLNVIEELKHSNANPDKGKPVSPAASGAGRTDAKSAVAMAQWIIANGGFLDTDVGRIGSKEKQTTVPKEGFSIVNVEVTDPVARFPWPLLEGLTELKRLCVNQSDPFQASDLAQLRALEGLLDLDLTGPISPEALAALPAIPGLKNLDLASSLGILPALSELPKKFPNIRFHGFRTATEPAKVKEAALAAVTEFAQWPLLQYLNFRGPLTVEVATTLAKMPKLEKILFYGNSDIAAEAVAKMTQLRNFVYQGGKPNPGVIAALSQLPALSHISLSADCFETNELASLATSHSLKALALTSLSTEVRRVSRHVPGLLKMERLEELGVEFSDLTDEDLVQLTRLKKLKRLNLRRCPQLTEAGINQVKKLLPRCEIGF